MKKILLVEDDPYIRDITATRLLQSDYELDATASGEEALGHLQKSHPDLILLDLDLPGMNGIDVLNEIALIPEVKDVPIIVFTNHDAPQVQEQVMAAGAKEMFNKSMTDHKEMLAVIDKYLA